MVEQSDRILRQDFDLTAYEEALRSCGDALNAGFMSIDKATSVAAVIQESMHLFKLSLGTPHFTTTLNLLERLSKMRRTSSNRDLVDAIPAFAQIILQDINSYIQQEPGTYLAPAFKLAHSFGDMPDPKLVAIADGIITNNFNLLLETEKISDREVENAVKRLIATGTPQQIKGLVRAAITPDRALSRRFSRQVNSILNLGVLGSNTYDRPLRMAAVLDELTGEQSTRIMNAWDDSVGKTQDRTKGSESIYFDNFGLICQLEKTRPGITKILINRYGILSFFRYPLDLLIEQYDFYEKQDIPYGIIIGAQHDINGVAYKEKEQITHAFKQVKAIGYGLKVYEAGNVEDISRVIRSAANNHGGIAYMLLMAHGDTDFINLGGEDESGSSIGLGGANIDTQLRNLGKLRDAFTQDAAIGLVSCFTGVKNGLAQMLSLELRDIDIHAADYKAFLKRQGIIIEEIEGQLSLKIQFGYREGNYNTEADFVYGMFNLRTGVVNVYDVPTRVYRNGRFIRDYTN